MIGDGPPAQQKRESGALGPHTSVILQEMTARFDTERVRIETVMEVLRGRAYGILLLLVAVAAMLPVINIVGAVLTVWIGLQMTLARPMPTLPGVIRRREVATRRFRRWVERFLPPLRWLERYVRPRYAILTGPAARVLLGILIVGLGFLLMVPVPFSQLLPGVALIVVAVALLQRDGLLVLAGTALSAGAGAIGAVMLLAFWRGVGALFA